MDVGQDPAYGFPRFAWRWEGQKSKEHILNAFALEICRLLKLADSRVSKRELNLALKICRIFRGARETPRNNFSQLEQISRLALIDYQNTFFLFLKAISYLYFSKQHIFNARYFFLWCTSADLFLFF